MAFDAGAFAVPPGAPPRGGYRGALPGPIYRSSAGAGAVSGGGSALELGDRFCSWGRHAAIRVKARHSVVPVRPTTRPGGSARRAPRRETTPGDPADACPGGGRGAGAPLPAEVRAEMEAASFGHDFGEVRVHGGTRGGIRPRSGRPHLPGTARRLRGGSVRPGFTRRAAGARPRTRHTIQQGPSSGRVAAVVSRPADPLRGV